MGMAIPMPGTGKENLWLTAMQIKVPTVIGGIMYGNFMIRYKDRETGMTAPPTLAAMVVVIVLLSRTGRGKNNPKYLEGL